jgi:hypothetical protein
MNLLAADVSPLILKDFSVEKPSASSETRSHDTQEISPRSANSQIFRSRAEFPCRLGTKPAAL